MKYSIFLIDVDDTILDFHLASKNALKESFCSFGKEWKDEYGEVFTKFNTELWERLERKEITRQQLTDERFPAYLKMLGIDDIDGEEYNQRFLKYLATHPIYMEGAENFLQKLMPLGRVYFVTNGTLWIQRSRFEIAGLERYAFNIFVSDAVGADKPAPKYTEYVIGHIENFERKKAVWVGDSLSADIKAANDAGIDSIWFNYREKLAMGGITPTYIAKNYQEVLQILSKN